MAKDAIKEIKAAEERANEIIKNAQIKSKELVKAAAKKAEDQYGDIINKAQMEAKRLWKIV
ncbi:hypothetical protein JTT01_19720 [Clostridium botulinum]|nr:hypothetical protein [Clostridium botulinum]